MISIKNEHEIEAMKRACRITAMALEAAKACIAGSRPGSLTTAELDRVVAETIRGQGAVPSFLGYGGFPGSACISVNEQVIHGIPGNRILKEGDIVKVDVGAKVDGFNGDAAATFFVGEVSENARKLAEVTRESFYAGIKFARVGYRLSDISAAIAQAAEKHGYGVVRDFVGHGIGRKLHEDPEVPNFGTPGHGPRLMPGMTLAIEPMISAGSYEVRELRDGWTVVTVDGSLTAHYEHSVALTEEGLIYLTRVDSTL